MFAALLMVGCGGEVESMIKEAEEKDGTYLNLAGVQISDLSPLSGLTNLKYLHLENNQITDLSPLKGLTNLKELRLIDNKISDITPLKRLTNLKYLHLENNQITDLSPLKGLNPNLVFLHLQTNPIPEDQKAMIKKALPYCDIYFRPRVGTDGIGIGYNDED